jgi:hypothetical protein
VVVVKLLAQSHVAEFGACHLAFPRLHLVANHRFILLALWYVDRKSRHYGKISKDVVSLASGLITLSLG